MAADLDPNAMQAAILRLRGHLVAAPLIGGLRLPGMRPGLDLRMQLEVLQPGCCGTYRGYLHALLRALGGCAGWVLQGERGDMVAAACAAAGQRMPAVACVPAASATLTAELASWSCRLERDVTPDAAAMLARRLGYRLMPAVDDPEFVAGMATLGVELAERLPAHCEQVFLPPALVGAVSAGMRAAGHRAAVRAPMHSSSDRLMAIGAWLQAEHRIVAGPRSLAVLAAAADAPVECAAAVLID